MDEFIRKHGEVIEGVLSCFDRMLFRGYLPIMSGAAMAEFLQAKGVDRWRLKTFLLTQAARLKKHAMEMAAAAGRPYQYLGERTRKEDQRFAERKRVDSRRSTRASAPQQPTWNPAAPRAAWSCSCRIPWAICCPTSVTGTPTPSSADHSAFARADASTSRSSKGTRWRRRHCRSRSQTGHQRVV
jgi:hypothetical protein